jgi:hypothetical protein
LNIGVIKVIREGQLLVVHLFLVLEKPRLKRNLFLYYLLIDEWLIPISLLHARGHLLARLDHKADKLEFFLGRLIALNLATLSIALGRRLL